MAVTSKFPDPGSTRGIPAYAPTLPDPLSAANPLIGRLLTAAFRRWPGLYGFRISILALRGCPRDFGSWRVSPARLRLGATSLIGRAPGVLCSGCARFRCSLLRCALSARGRFHSETRPYERHRVHAATNGTHKSGSRVLKNQSPFSLKVPLIKGEEITEPPAMMATCWFG